MSTDKPNANKDKISQFKALEERVEKTHKQVDESLELLEQEKEKGAALSKQLQDLTAQLDIEKNRQSDYFESKIQEEIQLTLNAVIMEEIKAQKDLEAINNLIKEREFMTAELEHMDVQNSQAPKELKNFIAEIDAKAPMLEEQKKGLKEESAKLTASIKGVNENIAASKQNCLELERKTNSLKELLPYINQYVDTEGNLKGNKANKDNSYMKKPFDVKKQTPLTKNRSNLPKEDNEDFWVEKDSESKARISAQKVSQAL